MAARREVGSFQGVPYFLPDHIPIFPNDHMQHVFYPFVFLDVLGLREEEKMVMGGWAGLQDEKVGNTVRACVSKCVCNHKA